jgi:hypothetical protein
MMALTWIDAALDAAGIQGGPVLFVHDEIVLEVPAADAERASGLLVDCMTRAFATTFPNAPLTNLVELKIVDAWGSSEPNSIGPERTDRGLSAGIERRDGDVVVNQRRARGGCDRAGIGMALEHHAKRRPGSLS